MFGHLTDITARADLADRLRLAAPAPDCSSSPGVWTGAPRRVGVPHPINPRLPKSATPVGATRDLAHWVGVDRDSVRMAKALIATRPPLNGSSHCRPAYRRTGTAHPCAPVPAPQQCAPSCWPPLPRLWETSGRPVAQLSRVHPTREVRVVPCLPTTRAPTRRLSRTGQPSARSAYPAATPQCEVIQVASTVAWLGMRTAEVVLFPPAPLPRTRRGR